MELNKNSFNELTNPNSGSFWSKWDLHVHSPASAVFKGDWEQFQVQLKNADCDVIGINDYFSVAGYKYIKEKIDKGEFVIPGKKILPVVEFRMTDTVQNKHKNTNGATPINFHIFFNDSIIIEDVENFIKSLTSNGTLIGSDYDDKVKLKDKKISLENLLTKLDNDIKFKNEFLLWLPYDEYGGIDEIDPNSDSWIKNDFVKKAHILGSSNKKQIEFFLWKSPINIDNDPKFSQEDFQNWFGSKKPCIKGSDSHSHDYPIGQLMDKNSIPIEKYCWIKAEPTFEGLKQIIYEAETRVSISKEQPKQPINTINSITLNIPGIARVGDDSFCFAGINTKYYLSPYFNCFIGGRGSGKSTILNFLGNLSNNPDSSKQFWKALNPSDFDPTSKTEFSLQGTENFEFLAQSEIETFAKDKLKFTDAIYGRATMLEGNSLEEYEDKITLLQDKLKQIIEAFSLIICLENKKNEIEKELRSLKGSLDVISSEEYNKISISISENTKELQKLQNYKNDINKLKNSLINIKNEFALSQTPDDSTSEYQNGFKLAIIKITEAIEYLSDDKFINEEKNLIELQQNIDTLETQAKSIIEEAGYTQESVEQIKSAPQKIINLEGQITENTNKLAIEITTINGFNAVIKEMKIIKLDYEKKIAAILKPLQDKLKLQFEENQGRNIKHITLEYSFDENSAWENLTNEFYKFFETNYKGGERNKDVCEFILENKSAFLTNDFNDMKNLLEQNLKNGKKFILFLDNVLKLPNNFQIFLAIRDNHLFDVKKYKIIQVKYNNQNLEQASFGQRCTAVIVILLLFGNYPLIIDEPEAHLDSSLIANYLVPLLKQKKIERQIIFATHNANFVINGDAEKIFILKNETGRTQIIETTIENIQNRPDLLTLEGGKEAFEKRGEKLDIKNTKLVSA